VVKLVARLGRSLQVRLVMLSDSALVKAIGLEGEGETRSNFAFVRLQRGHKGTIEIDGAQLPIDTSQAAQIAQRAQLSSRAWRMPRDAEAELFDLIAPRVEDAAAFSGGFDAHTRKQTATHAPHGSRCTASGGQMASHATRRA
jgi:hypothetical protein